MTQSTTNVGRMSVADPDLGYDTLDGGTALHAQLRGNATKFADHIMDRYVSTTLANGANTTITHNFGLNLARLKVQIWESGVLRSDAQVAADYTIAESGGSSTTAIVVTNSSGVSKTFVAVVHGGKLGVNSGDFDAACSIDTTGNVRAAELRTTGNDVVLNHDASGAGADWTSTIRRPSSGMSAAAVITLPPATSTLATLALAETLAAKTLTTCAGITLNASAAIDWAAGSVSVGASIGANTLTVGGSSTTVRTPGTLSSGSLATDSDDLVLNNDAASSSADWKATIRRPASGMAAAAVLTLPASTGTLATLARTEAFTNKDYDGGTASNTSRMTAPKDTYSNLYSLTRKAGTFAFATDEGRLYSDDGSNLFPATGRYVVGTSGSPVLVTTSGIGPLGAWDELIFVAGNGGAIDVTTDPQIVAGTRLGQRLTLIATHATNTVTFEDGTGLALNGPCTLGTNRAIGHSVVLCLFWNGSVWQEEYRS